MDDSAPGYRFRLKPTHADAALLRKGIGCSRFVWNELLAQNTLTSTKPYRRALDPSLAACFPRFKKKRRPQGIRFPQGFTIDGQGVYLPKIGWIGFRKSREIEGKPKNVTVAFDGQHWYVTIQTEREVSEAVHESTSTVGIDLGVARFAALSDGSFVEGANAFKKSEKRLAFLQRRLSRKEKFSSNRRKAKATVSRVQRKRRSAGITRSSSWKTCGSRP